MSSRLGTNAATVRPERSARAILSEATVDFAAGEVHAIVGPNGAGKSTLFGVISGDVKPTEGTAYLDGQRLDAYSPKELARLRSILLQHNTVSFPFTVHQVVEMGRAPWARTPQEDDDAVAIAEALAVTGVDHLSRRTISSLSGGERARVALARVLAQRSDILLLDEPTAALDLKHQEDVLAIVRQRADSGAVVAIVLHDLNAAMAASDRITLLSSGRVVASGQPSKVLTVENIEAVYEQAVDVFPHPKTGTPLIMPINR